MIVLLINLVLHYLRLILRIVSEDGHLNSFIAQDAFLKRHMIDSDGNDIANNSVKSMPDLYLPERLHVPRPTSTDLILQGDDEDDKSECLSMSIVKGSMGFGFTIADSSHGQKVNLHCISIRVYIIIRIFVVRECI